jgi:hypothetical protein
MMSFDLEQFLGILEQYNLAMWPLHIFAAVLGIVAVFCAIKKTKHSDKIILLILSLYWLWNGIVFCFMYWSRVYPFANVFGVLMVIQGILFLGNSMKLNLSFRLRGDVYSTVGIIFLLYAMVGYSVLGQFLGHVYPRFFQFGLVPCPTTIFTFGLFLLTDKKLPKYLLVIPLLSALSGILAVYWGVYEDIGLVMTGLLGTYLILHRDRKGRD